MIYHTIIFPFKEELYPKIVIINNKVLTMLLSSLINLHATSVSWVDGCKYGVGEDGLGEEELWESGLGEDEFWEPGLGEDDLEEDGDLGSAVNFVIAICRVLTTPGNSKKYVILCN